MCLQFKIIKMLALDLRDFCEYFFPIKYKLYKYTCNKRDPSD